MATPSAPTGKIVVGYWSIRGLGAPLRMMCEYAGVDYEGALSLFAASLRSLAALPGCLLPLRLRPRRPPLPCSPPERQPCPHACRARAAAKNYDALPKEGGGWDVSDWFDKKPELLEKNQLMNLPYVIDGDQIIAQTNACFAHLGRVLGLYGSNYAETVKVEQCLCQVRRRCSAVLPASLAPDTDAARCW